jgi:hypothetical protein
MWSPREGCLYEGVALQRATLRRRFPELSEAELDGKLQSWLAREDEAR